MGVLPVPDVVKDMAARLEGMANSQEVQSKHIAEIRSQMLNSQSIQALEARFASMEAVLKAMQTEMRSLVTALERR